MNRREALKKTFFATTGAMVATPLLSTVLFGSTSIPKSILNSYRSTFFNDRELELITAVTDAILPKTDSPSASEVGVPQKMDSMISVTYKKGDQKSFKQKFKRLEAYLDGKAGDQRFAELDVETQFTLLNQLDSSNSGSHGELKWTLRDLKNMTVNYYRSTRIIATEFLNYLPVPGYYDPCVSLKELGGKAWAI